MSETHTKDKPKMKDEQTLFCMSREERESFFLFILILILVRNILLLLSFFLALFESCNCMHAILATNDIYLQIKVYSCLLFFFAISVIIQMLWQTYIYV